MDGLFNLSLWNSRRHEVTDIPQWNNPMHVGWFTPFESKKHGAWLVHANKEHNKPPRTYVLPPRDSRPRSLIFLTRSQRPGSLRVYFSKWASYIVVPGADVTYVLTHENKPHPTSPPRFVFIFQPKKTILLGLFLIAHLTGCQELVDAFEASERDCALARSVRLGLRH